MKPWTNFEKRLRLENRKFLLENFFFFTTMWGRTRLYSWLSIWKNSIWPSTPFSRHGTVRLSTFLPNQRVALLLKVRKRRTVETRCNNVPSKLGLWLHPCWNQKAPYSISMIIMLKTKTFRKESKFLFYSSISITTEVTKSWQWILKTKISHKSPGE